MSNLAHLRQPNICTYVIMKVERWTHKLLDVDPGMVVPRARLLRKRVPYHLSYHDEAYREKCRIRQYFIQRCSQVVDTKEMEPLDDVGIDAMTKDMQNMGVWTSIVPGRLGSLHLLKCSDVQPSKTNTYTQQSLRIKNTYIRS